MMLQIEVQLILAGHVLDFDMTMTQKLFSAVTAEREEALIEI
jgi:hypothetical protein